MRGLKSAVLMAACLLTGCDWLGLGSSDASLSALSITGTSLDPAFSAFVFDYTATVDPATDSVQVVARASDSDAEVYIDGQPVGGGGGVSVSLAIGTTEVVVTVVSEDDDRRAEYRIGVTRLAPTYSIGGTVSGLTGSLTLQNNAGDDLVLSANGAFTFATELDDGDDYDVTVASQPADQQCTVANGTGTVSGADVDDIAVDCVTNVAGTYRVGGTITGLVGKGMLQLNGSNRILMTRNGTFFFGPTFPDGASYAITVATQPAMQTCSVTNGNGTFAGDNVLDVRVECTGAGDPGNSIFDFDWVNPQPQGNAISAFATDGSQVVAVGSFGLVQTSPDGLNWTRRDARTGGTFLGITWSGTQFVAVNDEGSVLTSTDGVGWQTVTTLPLAYLTDLVWNGSVFVAVGSDSSTGGGAIATSADGINWTLQGIGPAGALEVSEVAWNGNVFVAVQYPDYVHTSADGSTWSTAQIDMSGTAQLGTVASDGSRFVVADLTGTVYTSVDDGASWNQETGTVAAGTLSLVWDGSRFLAPGAGEYATSADGTSWTTHVVDPTFGVYLQDMIRFNGLNIAGANTGAVYTSADDASWTTPFVSLFSGMWDVIWDGSQFVHVGSDSSIRTSPDGNTWTTRNINNGAATLLGIVRGGGQYVAVGSGFQEQVLTSPDATTWTPHTPVMGSLQLQNVAWGNSQYVAVGPQGTILTSPDGATWTPQTTGLDGDEQLFDVAWNGSIWAVTGYQIVGGALSSFIATSPDGISWTKVPLPNWLYFNGIEWNGSRFVAINSGVVGTSTDGSSWSILQTTAYVREITWTGTEFITAGFGPDLLVSPDGLDWSVTHTQGGGYYGVASGGGTTVVLGYDGRVLTGPAP